MRNSYVEIYPKENATKVSFLTIITFLILVINVSYHFHVTAKLK
jgi:hypothetical protein